MLFRYVVAVAVLCGGVAGSVLAEENAMTNADLTGLLSGGKTLMLGGKGQGYEGSLTLNADGTGKGSAKTDAGAVINLTGTWSIKGDQFCRVWEGLDDGNEVCETWVKTSNTSVKVMNGDQQIGVNSW